MNSVKFPDDEVRQAIDAACLIDAKAKAEQEIEQQRRARQLQGEGNRVGERLTHGAVQRERIPEVALRQRDQVTRYCSGRGRSSANSRARRAHSTGIGGFARSPVQAFPGAT